MSELRVLLAGTSDFAAELLAPLQNEPWKLVGVLTRPDKPSGRGMKMHPPPLALASSSLGIPIHQPAKLNAEALSALAQLNPDVILVAAYGVLIPKRLLEMPRYGCVNVHTSLLPRWRGAAPVQRAILAGDEKTGVTFMIIDEGLDTGPILRSYETHITEQDTAGSLEKRLAKMAVAEVSEILEAWCTGDIKPVVQDDEMSTYATQFTKEDALCDFSWPATKLDRLIRAFYPRPIAWAWLGETRIRFIRAQASVHPHTQSQTEQKPGTILRLDAEGMWICCGEDEICVQIIQMPGRTPMNPLEAAQIKNSPLRVGAVFHLGR